MHELSIYKDIGSGALFSCLSKYTAPTEADGKWLESPRNKTSVGNFPKWNDIYNSCAAKASTATIAEAADTHPLSGFLALQWMMNQQRDDGSGLGVCYWQEQTGHWRLGPGGQQINKNPQWTPKANKGPAGPG